MAIQLKSLFKAVLSASEADTYIVPNNKVALIKGIRLVNTGSAVVTVNLYARRASGGTSYRIAPKDLSLAPGAMYLDDSELTLEGLTTAGAEDRIRASGSPATVDCVISGIERDV